MIKASDTVKEYNTRVSYTIGVDEMLRHVTNAIKEKEEAEDILDNLFQIRVSWADIFMRKMFATASKADIFTICSDLTEDKKISWDSFIDELKNAWIKMCSYEFFLYNFRVYDLLLAPEPESHERIFVGSREHLYQDVRDGAKSAV
jgi:hypothetical protein